MNKNNVIFSILILAVLSFTHCAKRQNAMEPKLSGPELIMNEGFSYLNVGDYAKAEEKLKKAVEKKPSLFLAINGLGIIYLNQRKLDLAIDYFSRVLTLNGEFVDAHNSLGIAYTEKGDFLNAKRHFLIAANNKLYSTKENAYLNLANLEIKREKYQAALRYVEKGLAHNDEFAPLFNMKAIAYEYLEDLPNAIANYKKALSLLAAEDATYLYNLGRAYHKAGQKQQAFDALEKALANTTSNSLIEQINQLINTIE
jgi:tetratricopeptide (TPR) repeat protein